MATERIVPGTEEWELYYLEHRQRYDFFAPRCRDKAVLDAACGIGYGSQILAQTGARQVTGIDIAEEALTIARKQFAHASIEYRKLDLCRLADAGTFDVVISFETLEHLADQEAFFRGIVSALQPDGLFVCSTPNRDYAGRGTEPNPHHLRELNYADFVGLFGRYFQIEERYHQSHSDAWLRQAQLLRELERLEKRIAFSRFLRLENGIRKILGRASWEPRVAVPVLPLQSDYYIAPVDQTAAQSPVTWILAGRPRL